MLSYMIWVVEFGQVSKNSAGMFLFWVVKIYSNDPGTLPCNYVTDVTVSVWMSLVQFAVAASSKKKNG